MIVVYNSRQDAKVFPILLTEALIADVEVPKVDSEIIRRYVCLAVRVDRDRVDVVGVGVLVDLTGDSGHDLILVQHPR